MVKVRKIILISVILILSISLIASCNGNVNTTLEDTKWFLRSYCEQGNLKTLIEGTEITATFDSSKAEVSGSAGCNIYFAR